MYEHPPGTCEGCDYNRAQRRPEHLDQPGAWTRITNDTAQESTMSMDRAEVIRASMARLEAELAALEAIPNPAEMGDDAVVSYERSYTGGDPFGTWYEFVAIRKGGRWYSTGRNPADNRVMNDADFRSLLADDGVRNIFRVAEWEAVAKTETDGSAAE